MPPAKDCRKLEVEVVKTTLLHSHESGARGTGRSSLNLAFHVYICSCMYDWMSQVSYVVGCRDKEKSKVQ